MSLTATPATSATNARPSEAWRGLLAIGVVLYGLYAGSVFFLPVVAATVLAFLMAPPFEWLVRRGVPRPLGALFLVLSLITVLGLAGYQLSQPISQWLDRMPQATETLRRSADALAGTMSEISRTARELGTMAESLMPADETAVKVRMDGTEEQRVALTGLLRFVTGLVLTLLLLFFCLATGGLFLKRLVQLPRRAQTRRRVVTVIRAVRHEVSRYLFTITMINIGLGLATALLLWAFGIPDFWLWGTLAAVSNFVPYVGTLLTFVCICFAASFTAAEPLQALVPGFSFLLLNGLEAFLLTPALVGARLSLNPVFILLSLIFWGALWDVFGLLMAVPILAALKLSLANWSEHTARWANLMSGVRRRQPRALRLDSPRTSGTESAHRHGASS